MVENIIFVIQDISLTGTEKNAAKQKKNMLSGRPDIAHHIVLTIVDSVLYKYGKCKIYLKTVNGIMIEICENVRIPRTLSRFTGLVRDVLNRLKVKHEGKVLLRVVRNKDVFPPGATKIGMSQKGQKIDKQLFLTGDVVLHISSISKGEEVFDDVDTVMRVSDHELSAAAAVGRAIYFIENMLNIF